MTILLEKSRLAGVSLRAGPWNVHRPPISSLLTALTPYGHFPGWIQGNRNPGRNRTYLPPISHRVIRRPRYRMDWGTFPLIRIASGTNFLRPSQQLRIAAPSASPRARQPIAGVPNDSRRTPPLLVGILPLRATHQPPRCFDQRQYQIAHRHPP